MGGYTLKPSKTDSAFPSKMCIRDNTNKHVFWNGEIKAAGLANRVVWNEVCVVNVGTLRPVDAMSNSPYKVLSLLLIANRSALNTACSNGNSAELGGQDMVSSTRVAKSK